MLIVSGNSSRSGDLPFVFEEKKSKSPDLLIDEILFLKTSSLKTYVIDLNFAKISKIKEYSPMGTEEQHRERSNANTGKRMGERGREGGRDGER